MEMMQGKMTIISQSPATVGKTVIVKCGSIVKERVLDSSLTLDLALPAMKEYTVSCGTFTEKVIINHGELKIVKIGYETDTWEGIKRIVDDGLTDQYFEIGDEKQISLQTGEIVTLQVAGIGTYEEHELTFISKNCISTFHQMNPSNTNAGGWNACAMRTYLNDTLFSYLPEELRNVISEKTLKRSIGSQGTGLQEATDKLWALTEFEINGGITYAAGTEAAVQRQYPIFSDAASKVKLQGENGAACYYWESSPYVGNSTSFCIMTPSGTVNGNGAGDSYGVVLCFCIRKSA